MQIPLALVLTYFESFNKRANYHCQFRKGNMRFRFKIQPQFYTSTKITNRLTDSQCPGVE